MIIDAHTHIFPDDQAKVFLKNTAEMFNVKTYGLATENDLISQMDENQISYSVIHMVAPFPSGVKNTNTWLINLNQDRFIKFGTVHPEFKDFKDEIKRLKDNNICGIKFQPDIQRFKPDDKNLTYPVYEELDKAGMKVMFHIGGEPFSGPKDRSKPHMIRNIALDFPDLKIIGAHLAGLNVWEETYDKLAGLKNIYMESSLSYKFINPAMAEKIIRKHGTDKIFFGSDYPFGSIKESVNAAKLVSFITDDERKNILGKNAEKFYLK
nr:amidohydrolase family protein [Bacteroidota bacterium]